MTIVAPPDIWNAATYAEFSGERARPFVDLTARIGAVQPQLVVDLGCGDGSTTALLQRRWPDARVIGVDSSADMLAAAAHRGIETVHADARAWRPDSGVDVVISNAMLQWIPDHEQLVRTVAGWLSPTGWLIR